MSIIANIEGTAPIAPLRTRCPRAVDSWMRALHWRLMGDRVRAWREAVGAGGATRMSEDDLVMVAIADTLQTLRSSGG